MKKNYYKKLSYHYYFLTNRNNFFFLLNHIKVVNLTTHQLKVIVGKRGIKNYKNMSREKLLSTIDE